MQSSKSTNVRLDGGPGDDLAALAASDPQAVAGWVAERFVTAPPRRPARGAEEALFRTAARSELEFEGERLPIFRFGSGPTVLLLHGWGGSSAQLSPFVAPLLERGMSVVAFDAPGHGEATGAWLAIPRFARAIQRVAEHVGPLRAVIGHSMGGASSAFAMTRGLQAGAAVLIGPPASEYEWFRLWFGTLGISEDLLPLTAARIEEVVGISFEGLRPQPLAAGVQAPLLVIHDRDDREVPYADGAAIAAAAPLGRLITTQGLGHRRILLDPQVVHAAVDFAANPKMRAPEWRSASNPSPL